MINYSSTTPNINLNQSLVNSIHQHGLDVWVYTVDRKQDVMQCIQFGVDAIFTNYPARTKLIVDQTLKNT